MAWRHLTLAIAALAAPFLVGADAPYYTDLDSYQNSFLGERPRQHFHSSKVVAPVYQINHWDAAKMNATESPYLFMAGNYDGWGASIVSAKDLSLVWADQCCNGLAQAARSWTYKGKNVLVVYVDGRVRIYDESYHVTHILEPQGSLSGLVPDSHEASMTFDDNVLMVVCPAVKVNLTSVGGPEEGRVLDCNVQEFDPDTKEVKFQFSTLSYFGVEDSVMEYKGEDVWDFCHMNSVEKVRFLCPALSSIDKLTLRHKTRDGNFIISYRHLSCVIMVDGRTNEVLWVMWGKKNMFTDVTDPSLGTGSAEFHFQHEPRFTGTNRFTLFDNHRTSNGFCGEGMDPCSRGLEVEFDPQAKTVWMVDEWFHPQRIKSGSRGGVQRTADNNTLVAWGQNPLLTEYTPEGDIAMDVQRGQVLEIEHGVFDVLQYRVWKGPWEGSPRWPPSIGCFRDSSEHPSLFVSWNGATKVETYVLVCS
jgi:hypothetical protein